VEGVVGGALQNTYRERIEALKLEVGAHMDTHSDRDTHTCTHIHKTSECFIYSLLLSLVDLPLLTP
jgi:hypothetical protein